MKTPHFHFLIILIASQTTTLVSVTGNGAGATIAATSTTVCGITSAANLNQSIQCRRLNSTIALTLRPSLPFSAISGGRKFLCGLTSGGHVMLCWDDAMLNPKRVYLNYTDPLQEMAVGDDHVCGVSETGVVKCWRGGNGFNEFNGFSVISSGSRFSCGVLKGEGKGIRCWGSNLVAKEIESQFRGIEMVSVSAGSEHVCGFNSSGFVVCGGRNGFGQLDVPRNLGMEYSDLALGRDFSCGIRWVDGSVVCWGRVERDAFGGISVEAITSGLDFVCGLVSKNLSVTCVGPGLGNGTMILSDILPGACVRSNCSCGIYSDSERLCNGNGVICKPCLKLNKIPMSLDPVPSFLNKTVATLGTHKGLRRDLFIFAIVGSVGVILGICAMIYWLWTCGFLGKKKIHDSVQPTVVRAGSNGNLGSKNGRNSGSFSIRRYSSSAMRRQWSGTSAKRTDMAVEFSFVELVAATNSFSQENRIGRGGFGMVYKGKLLDGRQVAIKRGEKSLMTKKVQENESAFESELRFLSRLNHKNLVRLFGYCQENDERLLVYEYMKNGALFDHLHCKKNVVTRNSLLNSWKMRLKIALDAARGIEYLHNFAVPPVIHRDIKSSNILLDAEWSARVSDFGLSLMGPDPDHGYGPMKPVGTVGYIDPEYYGQNVLTVKSDIYGLGVVLLELLTGMRALTKIFGKGPHVSVVDFAVPLIIKGDLKTILDARMEPPGLNERGAVEAMAHIAMCCVNIAGKDRPDITDIVANLERAFATLERPSAVCEDSNSSISSNDIVIIPD